MGAFRDTLIEALASAGAVVTEVKASVEKTGVSDKIKESYEKVKDTASCIKDDTAAKMDEKLRFKENMKTEDGIKTIIAGYEDELDTSVREINKLVADIANTDVACKDSTSKDNYDKQAVAALDMFILDYAKARSNMMNTEKNLNSAKVALQRLQDIKAAEEVAQAQAAQAQSANGITVNSIMQEQLDQLVSKQKALENSIVICKNADAGDPDLKKEKVTALEKELSSINEQIKLLKQVM